MGNGNANPHPREASEIAKSYANEVFKFGRGAVDTARNLIWDGAASFNEYAGILAAESKVQVVSGSADDKTGSGGATKIVVIGQGDDGLEISEEITLNGTTVVESNESFKVVYRAYVSATEDESEVTGPNHGAISIYKTGAAANTMAVISALAGQTLMCFYKVPSNKFGKLVHVRVFAAVTAVAADTIAILKIRNNEQGDGTAWNGQMTFDLSDGVGSIELHDLPRFLYPGAEIMLMGYVSGSTGTISGNFEIKLEEL